MIYAPNVSPLFLELRNIATQGVAQAALSAAADFIERAPKPWQYYLGVFSGATVTAVGLPGASLAFYAAALAVDVIVLKSPEGEDFDVFVDGIAAGSVTTYAANELWEQVRINLGGGGQPQRVEFISRTPVSNPYNWFALAGLSPVGGVLLPRVEFSEGKPWQVTISVQDAKRRRSTISFHYPYFAQVEDVERYTQEFVQRLLPVTDFEVLSVGIARPFLVTGEAPTAGASVYGKATFTLITGSRGRMTVTIPTWREDFTSLVFESKQRRPNGFLPEVEAVRSMLVEAEFEGFVSNPCDARGVVVQGINKSRYKVQT